MNTYTVYIAPKPTNQVLGGIGMSVAGERSITIVTDTLQNAMNLARGKIASNEEISGIYTSATDVIVDFTPVLGSN